MRALRAKPLERLVDAAPDWHERQSDGVRHWISFDCPIHEDGGYGGCRIGVPLAPEEARGWSHSGDTFDTLTTSPSIRVLGEGSDGCYWHGFIRDGRFDTCGDSR